MYFEAKTVILKDGSTALFRSPVPEDAAAFLDFFSTAVAETDFLLATPEEAGMSVEEERQWIETNLASPDVLLIACEIDGRIVGNCQIAFKSGAKTRHRASLAIALRQAYWNRGIGSALFQELITTAREHGVTQLELEYIQGNDRGRALYEKMGFVPWGTLPGGIRQPDGTMLGLIHMRRMLD